MKRLCFAACLAVVAAMAVNAQESTTTQSQDAVPEDAEGVQRSTLVDESTLILGEPSTDSEPVTAVSAFSGWDLVRMIVVLAAVVGIIYGIFYFLKKAGNGKFSGSEQIRLLGTRNLPGNRSVYLVQVGAQVFMLGGGGDAVTLLSEITDKETVDSLILEGPAVPTERRSFGDLIAGLVQNTQSGSLDLMRRQRERLQRMRQ